MASENEKTREELLKEELVKAAMMEELGKARMDTLPMEDNHRDDRGPRRGPPHRARPRQWAGSVTRQRPAGGEKPKTIWDQALTDGTFDDEDKAAVEGLDDLGGGRAYATRDQMVQSVTSRVLSGMNPRALERPEVYSTTAQSFRGRGQELPPGLQVNLKHSPTSKLGIVIEQGRPIHSFPAPNMLQDRTFVSKSGNVTNTPPAGRPASISTGPSGAYKSQRLTGPVIRPQKGTLRVQPLTSGTVQQPWALALGQQSSTSAPKQPAAMTLLDQKRRGAVFEALVKYVKGGGTTLKKAVWAVTLLSPAEAPEMGYFILFIKKNDLYQLEQNIVLSICQGVADTDGQVILRVQESPVRLVSQRLIFHNSEKAKDFLRVLIRLQKGGELDGISGEPIAVSVVETDQSVQPPSITTQSDTLQAEATVTQHSPTATSPAKRKVDERKVEQPEDDEPELPAPSPKARSDRELYQVPAKSAKAPRDQPEKSPVNTVIASQPKDCVSGVKVSDGHTDEPKAVAVEPAAPDVPSTQQTIFSDDVAPATAGPTTSVDDGLSAMDNEKPSTIQEKAPASLLFDLAADDASPQRPRTVYSNMDLLSDVNPWYTDTANDTSTSSIGEEQLAPSVLAEAPSEPNPWSNDDIAEQQDDVSDQQDDGEQEDQMAEQSEAEKEVVLERMRKSLMVMVFTLLAGFERSGAAGDTTAEFEATIVSIKQSMAHTIRPMAASTSYFGKLTEEDKYQVIEEFLAAPVRFVEPPSDEEDAEAEDSADSTPATAVVPPSRRSRIEYSMHKLLSARNNAVRPPAWLGELDFLPQLPGQDPVKKSKPARSATPISAGTGPDQSRSVSVTPLRHTLVLRPAAPPTPVESPLAKEQSLAEAMAEADALDALVERKLEPTNRPVLSKPVSDPRLLFPDRKPIPLDGEDINIFMERYAEQKREIFFSAEGYSLAPVKDEISPPAAPAVKTKQEVQQDFKNKVAAVAATSPAAKTKQEVQQDFKSNVAAVVTNTAGTSKSVGTTPREPDAKATQVVPPANGQANGRANGQTKSPGRLDPLAAAFEPNHANHETVASAEDVPPATGQHKGLGSSRWASMTTIKVKQEGRFTGLGR